MSGKNIYRQFLSAIQDKYSPGEADAIAGMLFRNFTGKDKADFIRDPDVEIAEEAQLQLNAAITQLQQNVPVQYIIGEVDFCGLKISVSPAALIPRPETEELMLKVIHATPPHSAVKVLDIGTGTGCIPISMKAQRPKTEVTAIDKSEYALALAMENAKKNQVEISFSVIDFLNEESWKHLGVFDIIISNPPYISISEKTSMDKNVLDHEPHLALFVADEDPLIFYRKIAQFSKGHLLQNAVIWLELNSTFAQETELVFEKEGYSTQLIKDQFENNRFLRVTHRSR